MKLFIMGAALRRESFNRKLAAVAALVARAKGATVDLADFADFTMPLYDGDIEDNEGMPEGGRKFSARVKAADGLIFSVPEYNNSVSGPFKNALDWMSREKPYAFRGKPVLMLGATSGKAQALQGIAATRVPLTFLGSYIYPGWLGVAHGATAFSEDGSQLVDKAAQKRLETLTDEFLVFVERNARTPVKT
jgi:NAD(P)H-dependent FMN reductase